MTTNINNNIYQQVIHQVDHRRALLLPNSEYSLEEILGQEFWGTDKTLHRAIGLLFSQLVKDGSVPFDRSGTVPFGHALYRRIPD